jgi:hypothetical protein
MRVPVVTILGSLVEVLDLYGRRAAVTMVAMRDGRQRCRPSRVVMERAAGSDALLTTKTPHIASHTGNR